MLKFPSYQELSREQDVVYNLPLRGSHLVVGPPGTGKTVMALYRATRLISARQDVHFLMYNHTLRQYVTYQAKEVGVESCMTTFYSWFYRWFSKTFHELTPEIGPHKPDWQEVWRQITARKMPRKQFDHLIIDEGQDFPQDLYPILCMLANNITVFADENQQINEDRSSIEQIRTCMGLSRIHTLTKNYRNSQNIAKFVRTFYAGLASGIPLLPDRKGPMPRAIATGSLRQQIEYIARYERIHTDKDIAVFVPSYEKQCGIKQMLEQMGIEVQTYSSKNDKYKDLNFQKPGIKILAYASSKGLDFDTVFLPDLDQGEGSPSSKDEKMRFYVVTARAREELFLMYSGLRLPPLLQKVPENLFERESLN